MLHRVFQIEDRQPDVFWHLGEVCAKKSKAKLGQSSPECFMQMLEANTDQSEESIPWSPLKMGCSRIAHSISWMPCASVPWCEGSDSQQTIAASSALCLHKEAHPCAGNAEFVLPPSVSQLLVPLFLTLLIITSGCWCRVKLGFEAGDSRAGSCEGEGTMQGASLGGAGTPTGPARFLLWENSDHQELCKAETSMWEASSD